MTARLTSGQRQYLSPRCYVPKTLQDARIGCTDHGASALAYLIKRRFDMGRKPSMLRILVDIDHTVYACWKDTESLALLLGEQPQLLVGVYTKTAEAADIAADLQSVFNERRCA